MRRRTYELLFALLAIAVIAVWYGKLVQASGAPRPGGLIGHGLGIVGFALMLFTEIGYTLRKRLRGFTWGSMNTWLQLHIFTGLVGPFLVLLHSAGKFHGLAGVVSALTGLLVLSGFVGRYIYTAAPRTLDGGQVSVQELEERIASADRQLRALGIAAAQAPPPAPGASYLAVLGRHFLEWRQQRRMQRALGRLDIQDPARAAQVSALVAERDRVLIQINCLIGARRLLALWYLFHVPLGALLFSLAFMHIGAALYYSTFLK